MPYGITQCYLSPGRGENCAFTPSRSRYLIKRSQRDARLSWPECVCVRQAMAVVNTRKMKFSPLKGSFSEKGLNEFLL